MTEYTEPFALDWESLVGGTVAFLKFLLGLYGVPDSSSQTLPELSSQETRIVARLEDGGEADSVRRTLERRLQALSLPGDSVERVSDSRLRITTRLPKGQSGLVGRILATGLVVVTHRDQVLLDSSDFEKAEFWPIEQESWQPRGVKLTLTDEGGKKWSRDTAALIGEDITVMLDGVILMSPKLMERISTGELVVSGPGIPADELVFYVNCGALSSPLELIEIEDASLVH